MKHELLYSFLVRLTQDGHKLQVTEIYVAAGDTIEAVRIAQHIYIGCTIISVSRSHSIYV